MQDLTIPLRDLAALAAEVLGQGGHFSFTARGTSMLPFIRTGDTLIVAPVDATALQPGDVILFQPDANRVVAHRVVQREIEGEHVHYKLRGDASAGPAECVLPEQVLGRVLRIVRGSRTIDLDHARHRTAVRLWIRTHPLGGLLIAVVYTLQHAVRGVIVRVQARKLYRTLARTLMSPLVRYHTTLVREDAPRITVITARLGGVTCGSATLRSAAHHDTQTVECWLSDLHVRRVCRGWGIGAQLVQRCVKLAAQAGAATAYLYVFEDNAPALALFHKLGFRPAVVSALEAQLVEEVQRTGRRRIVMSSHLK